VSIAVDTRALSDRLAQFGAHAFLTTVSDDQRPHVVSVTVALEGDRLVTSVGRHTGANLAARPAATFLWSPADADPDYSLIVDGTAIDVRGEGPVALEPTRAVLHRVAGAAGEGPTCVAVESH
jgi:Pyridoxamine 5'-phosphate oxidase